jgi:hypothetical protein
MAKWTRAIRGCAMPARGVARRADRDGGTDEHHSTGRRRVAASKATRRSAIAIEVAPPSLTQTMSGRDELIHAHAPRLPGQCSEPESTIAAGREAAASQVAVDPHVARIALGRPPWRRCPVCAAIALRHNQYNWPYGPTQDKDVATGGPWAGAPPAIRGKRTPSHPWPPRNRARQAADAN